ncbi:hypothetical protein AB0M19_11710 [Streptomyces sp. NPDC051920]|uniref:hypothetical protein n=1 Tax=Streptomyces sp. NPDC051920 TaxID=3155523 RepID=UPI003433B133
MQQEEAASRAEEFGRSSIGQWEAWGCRIVPADRLNLPGHYVFVYPPSEESGARLGGNWPIVVNERTGEARFVRGLDEYRKLKAARPPVADRPTGKGS